MPRENRHNAAAGRAFEDIAARALGSHFSVRFRRRHKLEIGDPRTLHEFDLVSECGGYIGECKKYTWTKAGKPPSAKLAALDQAVFYLQHVPADRVRFVVLERADGPKMETLAHYYWRTHRHLLNGVIVLELDHFSGASCRDEVVQMSDAGNDVLDLHTDDDVLEVDIS